MTSNDCDLRTWKQYTKWHWLFFYQISLSGMQYDFLYFVGGIELFKGFIFEVEIREAASGAIPETKYLAKTHFKVTWGYLEFKRGHLVAMSPEIHKYVVCGGTWSFKKNKASILKTPCTKGGGALLRLRETNFEALVLVLKIGLGG